MRGLSRIFGGLAQLARAPALHAGGQRFESVILHTYYSRKRAGSLNAVDVLISSLTFWEDTCKYYPIVYDGMEVEKGVWGMPRLSQAMKGATSCDNSWVAAHWL
jgi:hypothetical protein